MYLEAGRRNKLAGATGSQFAPVRSTSLLQPVAQSQEALFFQQYSVFDRSIITRHCIFAVGYGALDNAKLGNIGRDVKVQRVIVKGLSGNKLAANDAESARHSVEAVSVRINVGRFGQVHLCIKRVNGGKFNADF